MVSAALAETATGASRAAVQRNLALLQQRGLIREVTGQGRYRLWTARL
jgi:DNA-binding IclR family transcriptional regulator